MHKAFKRTGTHRRRLPVYGGGCIERQPQSSLLNKTDHLFP